MPASARAHRAHTARIHHTPGLTVVEAPRPHRRAPRAASVALHATGMVLGFLLAALASGPGGAGVVGLQLGLAAAAALVAVAAGLRARRVAALRAGARPATAPARGSRDVRLHRAA
jgi:hypothetical protein